VIVGTIQRERKADIFEIKPAKPYPEWFAQQRVVEQVDLANGEIVRSAPISVDVRTSFSGRR
jgi:hypothetical protein